jgi:GR25 family glycosyltransferase involved in LPS biosynthesis
MKASSGLSVEACVISLDRTPERLEQFRKQLGSLSEAVRWHPGVDGSTLDCEELVAEGVLDRSALAWPRGQIGCALSHLSAWRWCVEQGEALLIFEDDVQLAPDWNLRLDRLLGELGSRPWDLLLLGCNQDSCLQMEWTEGHRMTALFRPRYSNASEIIAALESAKQPALYRLITALGLAGYVITPDGAARMLEWVYPLRTLPIQTPELPVRDCFSLDGQMNAYYESNNVYIAFPPIAIGENDRRQSLTKG